MALVPAASWKFRAGQSLLQHRGLGIRFVASPRHADMLLVTGPVSKHMAIALKRTCDATPDPKLVVAVGDCGCSGGIFGESYASLGPVSNVIPVDVAIPGCPPAPVALLQGILAAITVGAPPVEPTLDGPPDDTLEGVAGTAAAAAPHRPWGRRAALATPLEISAVFHLPPRGNFAADPWRR
jgi:Ni,Fe-hydrogenase III small subunit